MVNVCSIPLLRKRCADRKICTLPFLHLLYTFLIASADNVYGSAPTCTAISHNSSLIQGMCLLLLNKLAQTVSEPHKNGLESLKNFYVNTSTECTCSMLVIPEHRSCPFGAFQHLRLSSICWWALGADALNWLQHSLPSSCLSAVYFPCHLLSVPAGHVINSQQTM